jgi:hypothetical protein
MALSSTVSRRHLTRGAFSWREVETPLFSNEARLEAGFLLRRLRRGESLELPKKTKTTPKRIIDTRKQRLARYQELRED